MLIAAFFIAMLVYHAHALRSLRLIAFGLVVFQQTVLDKRCLLLLQLWLGFAGSITAAIT